MKNENEQLNTDAAEPSETAEVERLRSENEELRQAVRMREARDMVIESLKNAGARSPQLLFEAAHRDLQFNDDGSPANASQIVERLKQQFPEQFGDFRLPVSIDAGAGTGSPPMLTKEMLARMSPAEIAGLDWNEVRTALRHRS